MSDDRLTAFEARLVWAEARLAELEARLNRPSSGTLRCGHCDKPLGFAGKHDCV